MSSKPHFFQPLIPDFENQFSIPEAFCKHLDAGVRGGRKLGWQNVVLRSPLGKSYTVTVHNGRELKHGWKQFVDEHDLHVGDFLVFRLEGEMVFDVMVFDPSFSERTALGTTREKNGVKASLEGKIGTIPPEISKRNTRHGIPGENKRADSRLAEKTPSAITGSVPIHKANPNKGKEEPIHEESADCYPRMVVKKAKKEPSHEESAAAHVSARGKLLNNRVSGCTPNLEKWTRGIKNEKPVHAEPSPSPAAIDPKDGTASFTVTLTHVSIKAGYLIIPREFAVKNGLHELSCNISLSNKAGIPYPVMLRTIKSSTTYLGKGWSKLVETHCLRVGDVLRFELTAAGQKPVMNFKVVSKMEC
ncbi:B3 domain-containing protein REM17 [Linum grandiflorum]